MWFDKHLDCATLALDHGIVHRDGCHDRSDYNVDNCRNRCVADDCCDRSDANHTGLHSRSGGVDYDCGNAPIDDDNYTTATTRQ